MKKKIFQSLIVFLSVSLSASAQNIFPSTGAAGIGTTSPNASSLLEVKSTTKGVLIPRMTQTQRNAIASPATGLLIYQTNATPGFYYYNGGWKALAPAGVNRSLSNLTSPTAINVNLIPGSTGTIDLGSSANSWRHGYFTGNLTANQVQGNNASGSPGVYGSSGASEGSGVYGSGYYGLYGSGTGSGAYGVYGSGTYGVYGNGATYGVQGTAGTTGTGVYGSAGAVGVYGSASANTGYGVEGSSSYIGVRGSGSTYGVEGSSTTVGVYGDATTTGVYGKAQTGVLGEGTAIGTEGLSYNTDGYGLYAYSDNGWGLYAETGNLDYYAGSFLGSIFSSNEGATTAAGFFAGDVYTTGNYVGSDQKLKRNIRDFSKAMDIINQLKPKQYEFRSDGNYKLMNLPHGSHYGLVAQDVEEVLPNLVKQEKFDPAMAKPKKPGEKVDTSQNQKSEKIDFKALNYTEFIPIMIKGMQELSQQNDSLKYVVSDLQTRLSKLESAVFTNQSQTSSQASTQSVELSASARLDQNIPNPFNGTTRIGYYVPSTNGNAYINFYASSGALLKSVKLDGKGSGTINVKASELPAGVYQYALVVDGKVVDRKQMVQSK